MRRLVLPTLLVLAIVALAVALRSGTDAKRYEFDAVFDTARGMVPGQLVKIAGARVGRVEDVTLTPDRKASFRLSIEERFGPLRADASCKILPEGFISESFVQCDPGTPGRPALPPLRGVGGDEPTVPLDRTAASVQLQQVIDTFSMPVSARIKAILTELGISVAGRGQDVNALLRRANPALAQTRQMLAILDREGDALGDAVTQTDAVLAELRDRRGALDGFVRKAGRVAGTTAGRSDRLQDGVRRLPALLAQTQTSLASLRTVSDKLAPTVRALGTAAPSLTRLQGLVPDFSRATTTSLPKLDRGLSALRTALEPTRKIAERATTASDRIRPTLGETNEFLESLRKTGGNEGLLDAFYGLATGLSPYDSVSHSVSIQIAVDARCIIQRDAPACSGQFTAPGKGQIPVNDPQYRSAERRAQRIIGDPQLTAKHLSTPDARAIKGVLDTILRRR